MTTADRRTKPPRDYAAPALTTSGGGGSLSDHSGTSLPIETNGFDRVFISMVLFVAINLFWMRFLEAHLSLYLAEAISVVVGYFITRYG